MKATFVFADQSTLSVKAFNSVKAVLVNALTKPTKLYFDYNTEDWIEGKLEGFPHFQDRDKQARIKWIDSCKEQLELEAKLDIREMMQDVVNKIVPNKPTKIETVQQALDKDTRIGRPGQYKEFFVERISKMNKTFEVPTNTKPTDLGTDRITKFWKVLSEEVGELLAALPKNDGEPSDLVAYADCLGDIVVYVFSEAERWGIPLVEVLHAILDSQDSKLVDGKPLWAPDRSKFIKGPNYLPPEDKIKEILERAANGQ